MSKRTKKYPAIVYVQRQVENDGTEWFEVSDDPATFSAVNETRLAAVYALSGSVEITSPTRVVVKPIKPTK